MRSLIAEQAHLGCHNDQGFPVFRKGLAAEQMKELRGRRGHRHAHVVLGAELQEPSDESRRVLRACAFVSVGKKQYQAVAVTPFRGAAADVLVDDDLGVVHEIAKLRLPDDEIPAALGRIPILEAQHRLF